MFALLNSSKEKDYSKSIAKEKKKTQPLRKNLFCVPGVHISNSLNEFRQFSI